jgi:hypothetical protein
MANGNLNPCSYCGGREFSYLPNVAFELHKTVSVLGMAGTQEIRPKQPVNLLICTSCGHMEWFAADMKAWQKASSQVQGAQVLRSS